jgi:hypothetical protein
MTTFSRKSVSTAVSPALLMNRPTRSSEPVRNIEG